MSDNDQLSAMKRKAGAERPPPEIGALTPGKALRAAMMSSCEEIAGLVTHPGTVSEGRTTVETFCEDFQEGTLIALLEGPNGRYGIILLDAQVLGALIEVQTTGRVSQKPAEGRAPTRTDAIMCADVIDALLEGFEGRAAEAELPIAPALTGYRYALALSEVRAIPMTLEDIPYRLFTMPVDLAQGAKQGQVQLLLPFDLPGHGPRDPSEIAAFTEHLSEVVMDTEAHLTGTLLRLEMPLSEAMALEVGALIPVSIEALRMVAIEDVSGRIIGHGRLGQVDGKRALCLTEGQPDDENGAELGGFGKGAPPRPEAAPATGMALPGTADALVDLEGLGDMGDMGDMGGLDAPEAAPMDLGGLGDLGEMGSDAPDLGGLGDLGSIGDLGELGGELGGDIGGDLPDLGSLGGLGDMESLDDLPETME